MTNADDTHFDDYRFQTEIKHRILDKYLPAYFIALSGRSTPMAYIDGFAGRGAYRVDDAERPGSPLLALETIASHKTLSPLVKTLFIEYRAQYCTDLRRRIAESPASRQLKHQPVVLEGGFADRIDDGLAILEPNHRAIGPVFLFVDPCGVSGVSLESILSVVKRQQAELFLFFNSSAIERILGAARQTGSSATLANLLGSQDQVFDLLRLTDGKDANEVERLALEAYSQVLKHRAGFRFILPYRVEAQSKRDTSHFLIHACRNCIGFKIMKHVMSSIIPEHDERGGLLELRQASASDQTSLMRFDLLQLKEDILRDLTDRSAQVGTWIALRVCNPTDPYSEQLYKRILLELETEGRLKVYRDRECQAHCPADSRRQPKGKSTLGDPWWIRAC